MSAEKVTNLTGEILKGLLPDAVVDRGVCADIDSAENGISFAVPETLGIPTGIYKYGVAVTMKSTDFGIQLYLPDLRSHLLIRCWYHQFGWRIWQKIELQPLST